MITLLLRLYWSEKEFCLPQVAIATIVIQNSLSNQVARSRDARRKADLERIKISFEDYYNDEGCYPPPEVLADCRGSSFQPYLAIIPCDPLSGEPYLYIPLEGQACKGYRVYAKLEDLTDPVIAELGCEGELGCGVGGGYNYGIAVGTAVYSTDQVTLPGGGSPTPAASPSPSGSRGQLHACDPRGVCNVYANPSLHGCPVSYSDPNCEGQCADPRNRCDS